MLRTSHKPIRHNSGHWIPCLVKVSSQSDLSFDEQAKTIDAMLKMIDNVIHSQSPFKCQFLQGKHGSGSHITAFCLLYGMLNGLQGYVASSASRRASHFNCHHIHRIFCINPNKKADPSTATERALKKLHYHPERKTLLMSLHVLFIEEIGLVRSELLATMDLILQIFRQNKLFFGGIFVIANGDNNQL